MCVPTCRRRFSTNEPGIRVEAVGLGGGEQAHDGGGALAGGFGAGEERDGMTIFDRVGMMAFPR